MRLDRLGLIALACMALGLYAADKKEPAKAADAPAADVSTPHPAKAEFGNTWALNGAYSMANLKGKVVVLFFYESG
ncbi:MAG: hypothetical protein WCT04_10245 [Planctomycetota bacterium]